MNDDEIKAFLLENRLLRLASIGTDGGPRVVPLAFLYEDEKFYLTTLAKSRKVSNIRANGKVGFCIDASQDSSKLRAVVGKGTAQVLGPGKLHDEMMRKLVVHLVGSLDHPYAKVMMRPDHVLIEITPTSVTSWNDALQRQGVT